MKVNESLVALTAQIDEEPLEGNGDSMFYPQADLIHLGVSGPGQASDGDA